MKTHKANAPIAMFDSGVGGLSVLRAIRQTLPAEDIVYFADQAHVPYGARAKVELLGFSEEITRFLMAEGAKLIVLACNTASAAALHALREKHPEFPFVGMEPAVKPAVTSSETGVVGVLATPSTFEGELYASVVGRFAQDLTLLKDTCPGLVEEIEAGRPNGKEANRILAKALKPMLARGLDSVVLGCTHYPFSFETIREIVGPDVRLIDPAPAIGHRVQTLLSESGLMNVGPSQGHIRYLTSGNPQELHSRIDQLLGEKTEVESARWEAGELFTFSSD